MVKLSPRSGSTFSHKKGPKHFLKIHTYTDIYINTTYTYKCIFICALHICIYIYTLVDSFIHICIHAQIYIYIHKYIHTFIDTLSIHHFVWHFARYVILFDIHWQKITSGRKLFFGIWCPLMYDWWLFYLKKKILFGSQTYIHIYLFILIHSYLFEKGA